MQNKYTNSIILNYDEKSDSLFKWYQQLIAESLGKKGKGILPIISNMPKDNHSVMQLYLDGFKNKITIMMDSGIKSGPDIARSIACGAQFTFLGRSFMYGVSALGKSGAEHTINLIFTELRQVMEQIGCEKTIDLPKFINQK